MRSAARPPSPTPTAPTSSKLIQGGIAAQGEVNHKAAAKFLAENGKKPDVVTTASGLQYRVLAPGAGATPKPTDEVTVNYTGKLLDGTEFDSSYKRGEPAKFPLNHVIPGWSEGVGLMKAGLQVRAVRAAEPGLRPALPDADDPAGLDADLHGGADELQGEPAAAARRAAPAPKQ